MLRNITNSVHRHDQSIDLGTNFSDTALQPDCNEEVLRNAVNTSLVVVVEESSLKLLAVHFTKRWGKYHLAGVAGKCTDQSFVHQLHHTTIFLYTHTHTHTHIHIRKKKYM